MTQKMNDSKGKTGRKKPAVIGLYGYSNSGKTTLIERLIRQLKDEGCSVAAVKISDHDIKMDEPGKDSWRYAQAGAGAVALAAQNETGIILTSALDTQTIIEAVTLLQVPDVIIVEGAQDASIRKVRLGEIEERENTIWSYDGNYDKLVKLIHEELEKE